MAENSDQLLHFHEYFKIIRNRLWVIFTIFTLTVISGYYVTNEVLPKIYSATAQIQILPRGITYTSGILNSRPDAPFDPVNFTAEYNIMQSPAVLLPVIKNLQLDKIWAKREFKSTLEALPDEDSLKFMSDILKLDFARNTNLVNITVSTQVPKESADIANAIAIQYKQMRDSEEESRNTNGDEGLRDQITQQQAAVDKQRALVVKMRADLANRNIDVPNEPGLSFTTRDEADLVEGKHNLLTAKEDYDQRRVLLDSVINLSDDQLMDTLDGMQRLPPDLSSLRSEVLKGETDKTNLLKAGYGEDNPQIASREAELDQQKKQIAALVAGMRIAMTIDSNMAKSRVALLQTEVDKLTAKVMQDTSNGIVPFQEAQRELEQQQTLLETFNLRLKQDIADATLQESPVRIISQAEPPELPSSPKKVVNYLISVAAGLFVGVGVAFLIEYLDTSVKTMADAETLLGLPVLTVIPNKGGPMPLIQDSGRQPHAEGYRILRAKLDLKVQNGIGPALTMLSGGPGEGKSTTIFNLAVVCAQAGQSVILVDCDLRRPTLHELLGVSNERGLSNYLRGEGEAVSFIQRSAIPKLQVLTAGNMPMSEIGVLAGDKIRHMLDDLKQRYDLVLIDAPPVLGISDGSIIAREVDYVILVIQHRRYPREISLRAKRAIEEVHGNCVGMVLNCVAVKSDDSYYYYSSYGNYYKKKKTERGKKRKAEIVAATNGKPVAVATAGRKNALESDEF